MVPVDRLQGMYHCGFDVFYLLSDPMGLLDKLVHDISLVFQNHFQIEVVAGIVELPVGEYSSVGRRHFLMVFSVFCLLCSATTLAGRFPNANCPSYTAFTVGRALLGS